MHSLAKTSFFALSLSCVFSIFAENTQTAIFSPKFQTLKVEKVDDFMATPVIHLGAGDVLKISFDEIAEDYSQLQWRMIHCNADWQPSRLMESEYVDGFNIADIEDFAYSSNTYIHYVNYQFTIPSEGMSPLVGGNYLVQVFDRYEPSATLLQARIQVAEPGSSVSGFATGRTDYGINTEFQQLAFNVAYDGSLNLNPYQDLIVTIEQNGRPETRRELKRPLRVNGNQLIYESLPELIFPAGNEYRRFETVRADYPGMGVDSTRYMGPNYHAWLHIDEGRAGRNYVFDSTQHGRFIVDEYNSTDPNLGADYVTMHFSLDFPEIMDGDIYVDGEFARPLPADHTRMKYNRHTSLYELELPLKQGSYNYQYVARHREGDTTLTPAPIEGNYSETSNEYNVCIYLRRPASRGDILIGAYTIQSQK
ncbi:MAG: DUF5103 domain-containing protein [Muribaculaceae bacterium]|nr:DUF5103 domain-containing protein [Muribaculaceae bacterium]